MMLGMICGAIVAVLLGVQPICGEATYSKLLEPALNGDSKIIARAVFDDYLEQVALIGRSEEGQQSRVDEIQTQQENANQADALFDSLLDSLSVLSDSPSLRTGIQHVRRTVILVARQADNPWPNTKWFDITSIVQTDTQCINAIDSFLVQHTDSDRDDRFIALIAKLNGDQEACAEAERRTMQRWAIYNEIVEPFENEHTLEDRYTTIPKSSRVTGMFLQITDKFQESKAPDIVRGQMALYSSLYEKQKHTIIWLIKNARINEGVDPLSSGCGSVSKTKKAILQRTAEIRELNSSTVKSMLRVLTPEQRQQLDEVE